VTIQDAIRSGKPFRRPTDAVGWQFIHLRDWWIAASGDEVFVFAYADGSSVGPPEQYWDARPDDLLADDWEIV
jgi:hypothetical protein